MPIICSQPSLPAAFWLRKQQQLSCVGARQTVGSGHRGGASTSASTAHPGCPVATKHERKRHHPRGDGRITRPGRFTSNHTLSRTFRHRLSTVANSANRAALRDGTSCPSEVSTVVRINQHRGVRVSGNMQPFHPSHTPSSCQCAAPQHTHSQCLVQHSVSQDSVS